MDLDTQRYATYEELELYCYRVASVVGLLSIEIFGYQNPACRDYAVHLGKALQLTNILRDVRTDAERGTHLSAAGRVETVQGDRSGNLPARILRPFAKLAASVAARARNYYRLARETLPAEDRRAMVAAELMGSVYWRLLAQTRSEAIQCARPRADALEQTAKAGHDLPHVAALRSWRHGVKLRSRLSIQSGPSGLIPRSRWPARPPTAAPRSWNSSAAAAAREFFPGDFAMAQASLP